MFDLIKQNKIEGLENLSFVKQEYKVNKHTRLDVYGEKIVKKENSNIKEKYFIEIKNSTCKRYRNTKSYFPKRFLEKKK